MPATDKAANEANGRHATVTFSLCGICFPSLVFNLLPCSLALFLFFHFLIRTALITPLSPLPGAIHHRLPSCVGKQELSRSTLLSIARRDALMKVSGPLHTHGCFHWALTHLIPSSLILNPQTVLLERSVTTPCFTLSYQVNLSCTRRGTLQLDANELRHYEMNENFLF